MALAKISTTVLKRDHREVGESILQCTSRIDLQSYRTRRWSGGRRTLDVPSYSTASTATEHTACGKYIVRPGVTRWHSERPLSGVSKGGLDKEWLFE